MTMLAQLGINVGDHAPLESTRNELLWFTHDFNLNNSSFKVVNKRLTKPLEILSNVSIDALNPKITLEIFNLIVATNNILVDFISDQRINPAQHLNLMALFCPAFTHFAVQRIDLFINVAVPQLKIPNVLHPSTVMWGSKIVLKVMEVINDHNPLNPFIECIVVKFTGIVKDAPENEAVVRKMKVIVAELCKYLTNNLIICECLSMCLRSDDSKVLTSTMKTIEVKGIDVIAMIWPILVSKKETQFVERLATMLHGIYEKNGRNCDVFRVLPQNEKYTVDMLQKQFETAVAAKKTKKSTEELHYVVLE